MTLCLGGIIIALLLPTMAWGLGRQAASTDWDAPAEERAEAARGSCLGILLTAALLAAQWWAVDADGFACWYGVAPPFLPNASHAWDSEPEGRGESVGYINLPVGVDWRTTLRRRPEVTE